MRVAWVHPTWRDLVIERLADDAALRRHFLARCGPHGIVLALSTGGGAAGERRLPLVAGDDDWDALGDRIHAVIPQLDHLELVAVLSAVRGALDAAAVDWRSMREARALARMALERSAALWNTSGMVVELDCLDAWLSLSNRLDPPVWPTFLVPTWAELLPAGLPESRDLAEVQRFTDWVTLCELLGAFAPGLLEQLGYGEEHDALIRRYRHDRAILEWSGQVPPPREDTQPRQIAEATVRRVLADL